MDAAQLMQGGIKLIYMFSPFMFVFIAIAYADQIIDLIKQALLGRKGGYD
jgi:hypothetical protein